VTRPAGVSLQLLKGIFGRIVCCYGQQPEGHIDMLLIVIRGHEPLGCQGVELGRERGEKAGVIGLRAPPSAQNLHILLLVSMVDQGG